MWEYPEKFFFPTLTTIALILNQLSLLVVRPEIIDDNLYFCPCFEDTDSRLDHGKVENLNGRRRRLQTSLERIRTAGGTSQVSS